MRTSLAYYTAAGLMIPFSLGPATQTRASSFAVDDWFVSATVDDFSAGSDTESFYTVQNPFNASHTATLANSTCQASYNFAWWDTNGAFLIQSTQAAQGVPTSMLVTDSSGFIYVTPSVDLTLTVNAQWTYDLPRDPMLTTLLVTVSGLNSHVSLFGEDTHGQTGGPGYPAYGTRYINSGVITLPPTDTWVLRYGMNINTFSGSYPATATGNGFVNFTITPEPASLALLTLAPFALSRPRPHPDRRQFLSPGSPSALLTF